jgi:putative transposase
VNDAIINRLKEVNRKIAEKGGVDIINQECDKDHEHILFGATPQTNLVKFINSLKGVSARRLRKEFPELKKILWKDSFWSSSYCLISTGQVTLDQLKKYVENQGK